MGHPVVFILAHPDLPHSRANRHLADAAARVEGVQVIDLYARHPDLFIEGREARPLLESANALVVQHPVYWYAMPGLLKEWFDRTFATGWAYGRGGTALQGKAMLASITTGSDIPAYGPDGPHGNPVSDYLKPLKQTALFCGMNWLEPLIFYHARSEPAQVLGQHTQKLTGRLEALVKGEH